MPLPLLKISKKNQQENLDMIDLKPVTLKLSNLLESNQFIDHYQKNNKPVPSPGPYTNLHG